VTDIVPESSSPLRNLMSYSYANQISSALSYLSGSLWLCSVTLKVLIPVKRLVGGSFHLEIECDFSPLHKMWISSLNCQNGAIHVECKVIM